VGGLRALPEAEQYAVMQPHREGTDVLDVSARALRRRPETFDDAHQKWWGRRAHATLLGGRLTLVNAEGAAHTRKAIAHALAFTPDDRHAVFFERSTVTFWDLARHAAVATAKVRAAGGLALSPRGDEVALWGAGTLCRFGVPDGVERAAWKSPTGLPIATAVYASDGARLAVAAYDVVWVIDAARNVEVARLEGAQRARHRARVHPRRRGRGIRGVGHHRARVGPTCRRRGLRAAPGGEAREAPARVSQYRGSL
jgi:hypothetical protein